MTSQDSGGRDLGSSDLLRPPDNELEAALVASANRWIADVAELLPDLSQTGASFSAPVDGGSVLGELSAVAWSGAGTFEAISADQSGPPPVISLSGPVDIAELMRSDTAVIAKNVQMRLPSIADVHDRLTAASNAALSVSVILTSGDVVLELPTRSTIVVAHGGARLGSASELLSEGNARVVSAGSVGIRTSDFTVLVALEFREFGPRSILEQLSRSAGHDPLFRADLPRRLDAPFTSYGGSLLDEPEALGRSALAIYDDGVPEQARCWWNASLRFATGPIDGHTRSERWRLRWPAPPAFGDRRLAWSGSEDDLVIAMAGHVVAISPDLHGELLELTQGDSITVGSPLYRVFGELGLLAPA